MPAPSSVNIYSYLPVITSTESLDPAAATPIGVGDIAFDNYSSLSLHIGLPSFATPVDVYIGIYAPTISSDLWLINSAGSFQQSSSVFAKWKANSIGPVDESLYGTIPNSALLKGLYNLYLLVTPADDTSAYYLWTTSFFVSHFSPGDAFVEGVLFVKFKPNTSAAIKMNVHEKYGSRLIKVYDFIGVDYIKLRPDISVEDAVKLYESEQDVDYAEPDIIYQFF